MASEVSTGTNSQYKAFETAKICGNCKSVLFANALVDGSFCRKCKPEHTFDDLMKWNDKSKDIKFDDETFSWHCEIKLQSVNCIRIC